MSHKRSIVADAYGLLAWELTVTVVGFVRVLFGSFRRQFSDKRRTV